MRLRIPLSPRTKRADLVKGWQTRPADDPVWALIFAAVPKANVGIRLDDLLVVDLDSPERVAWYEAECPVLSPYRSQGRRDRLSHWYTLPADCELRPCRMDDWEVKLGPGHQVVVPPSTHPTGVPYRWSGPELDAEGPPPDAPVEWLAAHARAVPERWGDDGWDRIPEGHRNRALFALGCQLRRHGASVGAILEVLELINQRLCHPPLETSALVVVARSAGRYRAHDPSQASEFVVLDLEDEADEDPLGVMVTWK